MKKTQSFDITTIPALHDFAHRIVATLQKEGKASALVSLVGDLGSGKTTFVKQVAEILDIQETVTSPTYTIRSDYDLFDSVWEKLVHYDLYRLGKNADIEAVGFSDSLVNAVVFVEWAEYLPKDTKPDLTITFQNENEKRSAEVVSYS